MGFTVSIHFHGTILLIREGEQLIHMLVPQFDVPIPNKALVPYIRFPEGSLRSVREPWDTKKGLQHIVLDDELLEFRGIKETGLDANFAHQFENTPTKKDKDSLHWLPDIQRLIPGATVNRALLEMPARKIQTTNNAVTLAARVDIRNGKLRTSGIKAALPFRSKGGNESVHNVAREAILTFDVSGDSFTITSRSLRDDPDDDENNDMEFAPLGDSKTLELVIGNEPSQDIYATAPEMDIEAGDMADEFGLFYQLYKLPPGADPPLPLGKNKGGSTHLCANAK